MKHPQDAQDFCDQIQDMINQKAAVILSKEELEAWEGDYLYLSLVGVQGKRGKAFRVCFDAATKTGGNLGCQSCGAIPIFCLIASTKGLTDT